MTLPSGTYSKTYVSEMAILRTRLQWGILIASLVFLFTLPLYVSGSTLSLINAIGIMVISVHGVNLITGYAGLVNMGQAAFMAVGAYTTGYLMVNYGVSFWLCLPLSGLTAGVAGMIFATPSLRIRGFYLAMATLAAQFIIPWAIVEFLPGSFALIVPAAKLGNFALNTQARIFYLIIPLACLVTLFIKNIVRSRVGRALVAIRDNEDAAELLGVNLFNYKLIAFFISAVLAGIAGSLYVVWARALTPEFFTLYESIWMLAMIIVGGMGSVSGTIMGVIAIKVLENWMAKSGGMLGVIFPTLGANISAALPIIVFGLLIIIFLIFEPRGLAHRWEIIKASYRIWPLPY